MDQISQTPAGTTLLNPHQKMYNVSSLHCEMFLEMDVIPELKVILGSFHLLRHIH